MSRNKSSRRQRAAKKNFQTAPPSNNGELQVIEENLEKKIPALQQLPRPDRMQLVREVRQMTVKTTVSSPFPPPEFIRVYEELLPGGAERLMNAAEKQSNHRMELEKHVVEKQQAQARTGQIFAFIVAILCIGASLTAALTGHEYYACVLGGGTLVSLVVAFITGKHKQRQSLDEKSDKS